jgi:TP901 family phage tail tape measure protein
MPVTDRVEYIIGLRDNMTRKLRGMSKATKTLDQQMMGLGKRFLGMAAVAGVARGIGKMVSTMADFEEVASNVSAITGATGDDLDFLKRKAIELGSATTKSSIEALEGFKLIASAKPELLGNAAALAATTKEAIALSEASGLDVPAAAKSLTSALNQFDLAADQSSRVINVLAAGSKFAAAEIPELAASLDEFGGVAASLGITLEESAAAVETLSAKNLKGARAGIQLRNVLLKLGGSTDRNINPSIVGLGKALENLAPIQDNVTELTKMFGRQNVLAAQTLIKSREKYEDLTVAMTGTNIAYEQARVNTDNLKSDILGLNSAWEGFVLNLNKGEGEITNVFRGAIKLATQFAEGLSLAALGEKGLETQAVDEEMAALMQRLKDSGVTEMKDLRKALDKEYWKLQQEIEWNTKRIAEAGGIEKVIKKRGFIQYTVKDAAQVFGIKKPMEKLLDRDWLKRRRGELAKINSEILKMESPDQLQKLFETITGFVPPGEEIEFAKLDAAPEAAKQIATITGAAPKTFNINIEKLIETQEINTTNLEESAFEVKMAITRAMGEALADVEPITQ